MDSFFSSIKPPQCSTRKEVAAGSCFFLDTDAGESRNNRVVSIRSAHRKRCALARSSDSSSSNNLTLLSSSMWHPYYHHRGRLYLCTRSGRWFASVFPWQRLLNVPIPSVGKTNLCESRSDVGTNETFTKLWQTLDSDQQQLLVEVIETVDGPAKAEGF